MKKIVSYFHWIPRILAIMGILFISMFALDSFTPDGNLRDQIPKFLKHLIPSYVLVILLILSWKRELMGGILFLLVGLLLIPFIFSTNLHRTHSVWMSAGDVLIINIPFVIVGVLFILSYRKKRKIFRENIKM